MKRYVLSIVICGCPLLPSAVAATNVLSIHLVAKDETRLSETNLGSIRLMSPPVLADADFVSFDWKEQTFVITPQAAQRLAAGIWSRAGRTPTLLRGGVYALIPFPTPFVVKALGEPVYVGAFYWSVFSSSFKGPVILADESFISSSLTTNITFRIELGYPGAFSGTADLRRDQRIFGAVQKLFPHEKR